MEFPFETVAFWIKRQKQAIEDHDIVIANLCQQRIDQWVDTGIEQLVSGGVMN